MSDSTDESATSQHSAAPAKHKRSVSIGQILAGILLVLVIIFIAENGERVDIRFIAGPKVQNVPMWLALFGAAVVGALIAWLLRFRREHRKQE